MKLKETIVAYAVWAVACSLGCEKPSLYVTDKASFSLDSLYKRSIAAHAERMSCLDYRNDTIVDARIVTWQVITPNGDGVQALTNACGSKGTVHTHIMPAPDGSIDSLFSKGDLSVQDSSKVYCVIYSEKRMRCRVASKESVINYDR